MGRDMGGILLLNLLLWLLTISPSAILSLHRTNSTKNRWIIDLKGGPDDVVWVVQLSDLHFSVHHPDRAIGFKELVGPALSMINPSLVLITGDLTDGKSKDLLTMRQDEKEWVEYLEVMDDVVRRSGLNRSIFYDLRGNHDNFGVPVIGGSFDYFSTYSLNSRLGRSGQVNSVTVQAGGRKLLFVGLDSTMSIGLRGPTNLFGHPTDQLLAEIGSELSQWDSQSSQPVMKLSFGHFPLSFSAPSYSGKTLKDIFLNHSLSTYLCGHLHTRFGKNLKRHHQSVYHDQLSTKYIQLNAHQMTSESKEFWELEMGDWRKSRAMRILAIDRGHMSFIDTDFKLGARKTIILPTFPLDSRFVSSSSSDFKSKCHSVAHSPCGAVRALVFSTSPIVSVVARIYDSRPGNFVVVMEAAMKNQGKASSRGDLYSVPWDFNAFEDPSPQRFWLQIEATDIIGSSTLSELRPFSINGHRAKLSWTWKEFLVMGCQWDALYYPILWSFYIYMFSLLLIPKAMTTFSKQQYTYRNFKGNKGFINGMAWVSTELQGVRFVWFCILLYLFYLILCPWFYGRFVIDGGAWGYMTYRGWVMKSNNTTGGKIEFLGFPDVMVVVLPHLFFVVLPAVLVIKALAAERGMCRDYLLSLSGKKNDDYGGMDNNSPPLSDHDRRNSRWMRRILLLVSLAICWKHLKNCRALMKAYEMNSVLHFPLYSMSVPLLLAYTVYQTRKA